MTPGARVQATIDLLDLILASVADNGPAADTITATWFKTRRFAGSGDRRAVRALVYRGIRAFGDPPISGRAAMVGLARADAELAACFDGSPYGPKPIQSEEPVAEPSVMPAWLGGLIAADEHEALLDRAPLDLRVNRLKSTPEAMHVQFSLSVPINGLPDGLRCVEPFPVERDAAWTDGLIEIQDAGSQWVAAACAAKPGMTVIDLCAGGGGKTLALASAMNGQGTLIACDVDRGRLSALQPRAIRAGANIEIRLLDGGQEEGQLAGLSDTADVVLVDAPCSGSGTLRRNPEARWRITPDRLTRVLGVQAHVLDLAAPLVKPGGALVYAVCSLIEQEGDGQIAAFLTRHPGWTVVAPFEQVGRLTEHGRILSPAHDETDGFFVARLIRSC